MISYNNRIEKIAENNSDKVACKCFVFFCQYTCQMQQGSLRDVYFF